MTALIGGPVGVVALWLCFEHRPAWYRPVRLDEGGIKRVRRESTATVDDIGDRIVQAEQFDVVITDRSVTEWLTALPHIWPAARRWWPNDRQTGADRHAGGGRHDSAGSWQLSDPAVRFADDRVFAGAHFESVGWRAILNIELTVKVSADGRAVEITLIGAYGGSLSVPRVILERVLVSYLPAGDERLGLVA